MSKDSNNDEQEYDNADNLGDEVLEFDKNGENDILYGAWLFGCRCFVGGVGL